LLAVAAALRTGSDLDPTLATMAESVAATLGVATATIVLYRPAFHDFETVAVHGSQEARRALLGTRAAAEEWAQLLDERFGRRGAYFIPAGRCDPDPHPTPRDVADLEPSEAPDAWQPGDALFVPLRSSTGAMLGVLSVDEPHSARRPAERDIDLLVGVAAQAGLAIESAQQAQAARRHHADVRELLRISSRLTSERSRTGIARATCEAVRDALGFERVAAVLRDEAGDRFRLGARVGWGDDHREVHCTEADLRRLLTPEALRDGCVLLAREEAHARTPAHLHAVYSSQRNGRGPHGWDHHWLLVPLHDEDERLIGLVCPDDPADRLLPTQERLRTLRAFANQAASALEAAATRKRLARLAEQDPLTGLRNRRNLHREIDAVIEAAGGDGAALIVVDADAFKRVNDELGYETGDAVLRALGRVIGETAPPGGLAARLGGEEFALVLPRTPAAGARMAAEALRRAAAKTVEVPWGLTLSAGLAVTGEDIADADSLLRAATRALAVAKRLGRDRVVAYDPVTLESLLATPDSGDGRDAHQLSAVLLLAETLDLRDAGTARHSQTVGRYAEAIAAKLDFHPDRVERVKIAGLLHDIGKLATSDAILHKPSRLEPDEWTEIRRHPEVGARICSHAGLRDIAAWVLSHHERWAGGGYPFGLAGTSIPLEARILGVADAYEAMTASRPYRTSPLSAEAAQGQLRDGAGTQFDPAVVDAFLTIVAS